MKLPNFSQLYNSLKVEIVKHSPEILTGLGIAGMVTTTVLAVKATPKAVRLIERAEDHGAGLVSEEGDPNWLCRPLTKMETIKVAWKPYIPAAITFAASTGCLIGAQSVNARRNAALATAYQLSTSALNEYKEKVIETIGEKKEQEVRDKIAQDKVDKANISSSDVLFLGDGEVLCMDAISGRVFKSNREYIRQVANDLNASMIGGSPYISLAEFQIGLGIDPTPISYELGWNLHEDGLIELDFSGTLTTDGKPCLYVDYKVRPRYDYSKLM